MPSVNKAASNDPAISARCSPTQNHPIINDSGLAEVTKPGPLSTLMGRKGEQSANDRENPRVVEAHEASVNRRTTGSQAYCRQIIPPPPLWYRTDRGGFTFHGYVRLVD